LLFDPGFDDALFSLEWTDALWDRYVTQAPPRQRRSTNGLYKVGVICASALSVSFNLGRVEHSLHRAWQPTVRERLAHCIDLRHVRYKR
jgi:hypothetical protein